MSILFQNMKRIHQESFILMYAAPIVNYSVIPTKTSLWILAPWTAKEQSESPRTHAGRRTKGVFTSRVVANRPMRWSEPLRQVLMGSLCPLLPMASLPTCHWTLVMGCNNMQIKPLENLMPLSTTAVHECGKAGPDKTRDFISGTCKVAPAFPRSKVPHPNKKQWCSAPTGYHSARGQGTKISICLCLMILISLLFYWKRTILLPLLRIICSVITVATQHKSLIEKNYDGYWQWPRMDGKQFVKTEKMKLDEIFWFCKTTFY